MHTSCPYAEALLSDSELATEVADDVPLWACGDVPFKECPRRYGSASVVEDARSGIILQLGGPRFGGDGQRS
jgi:hypothetical protein